MNRFQVKQAKRVGTVYELDFDEATSFFILEKDVIKMLEEIKDLIKEEYEHGRDYLINRLKAFESEGLQEDEYGL